MKISNQRELQQLYSSDIHFQDFMNLYKKCTAKPYSSDATRTSDNPSRFRKNLLERI